MMWTDGEDSLNIFIELTIQNRIDDPWYVSVMEECRYGQLSEEAYNYLVGLPTEHTVSRRANGSVQCQTEGCASLPATWNRMPDSELNWPAMQHLECAICQN